MFTSAPDTSSAPFHLCCCHRAFLQSILPRQRLTESAPTSLAPLSFESVPRAPAQQSGEFVRRHSQIVRPRRSTQDASAPPVSFHEYSLKSVSLAKARLSVRQSFSLLQIR